MALAGVLVLILTGLSFGAGRAYAAVPSDALGVNVLVAGSGSPSVPTNLALASAAGMGSARVELTDAINPDRLVASLAANKIRLVPMLGLSRQLSASGAAVAMAQYVVAFAQRFGPNGSFWSQNPRLPYLPVESYEIGNEPNMPLGWVADQTNLHWSGPSAYAQVYEAARTALHRVDASGVAIVGGLADSASGGVDVQSDEEWLAALTPGTVDAVGYHPYTFVVSDSLMSTDTEALRQWMNSNGFEHVPLAVNEFDACDITPETTDNIQCPADAAQSSTDWGAVAASYTEWALCTPSLNVKSVSPFLWGDDPSTDADVWLALSSSAGALTPYGQRYLAEAHALTTVGCPPVNSASPDIGGQPVSGQALTAHPGTWAPTPLPSFAYQWQRCDTAGADCTNVPGATSSSYQARAADVGSTLVVSVTATNPAGSATAVSAPTNVVTAPDSTPNPGPLPPPEAPEESGPAATNASPPGGVTMSLVPMELKVSAVKSRGHLLTVQVSASPARGLVIASATKGTHRVMLHRVPARDRSATDTRGTASIILTGKLAPGRWTLIVTCIPPPGYAAPQATRRTVSIVH